MVPKGFLVSTSWNVDFSIEAFDEIIPQDNTAGDEPIYDDEYLYSYEEPPNPYLESETSSDLESADPIVPIFQPLPISNGVLFNFDEPADQITTTTTTQNSTTALKTTPVPVKITTTTTQNTTTTQETIPVPITTTKITTQKTTTTLKTTPVPVNPTTTTTQEVSMSQKHIDPSNILYAFSMLQI